MMNKEDDHRLIDVGTGVASDDGAEGKTSFPINDWSVLPSISQEHRNPEDGGNSPDERKEHHLEEWNKWDRHRETSHVGVTTTPNDCEDFESSDRFVSRLFAIASTNPSAMNSIVVHQQAEPSLASNTVASGFNMKQYEEELVKLRNDNFSLKLRIHLLEERQGLEVRPGDNQENIFRVNLDLRVEKETLKQQIEEKNKLLRDAYLALEEIEGEKNKLEADVQFKDRPDLKVGEKSQQLLLEAFGSMNLGSRPSGDVALTFKGDDEAGQRSLKNSKDLEKLQQELDLERNKVLALVAEKEYLESEFGRKEKEFKEFHEDEVVELSLELENKNVECVKLREEFTEKEQELLKMREMVGALEYDGKQHQHLNNQETDNLQKQIANLKFNYEQELAEYETKFLAVNQDLKNSEEAKLKSQLSATGLSKMNLEQKERIETLEIGLEKRDKAIKILRNEYEKLKAKVRQYRSEEEHKPSLSWSLSSKGSQVEDSVEIERLRSELNEAREKLQRLEDEEDVPNNHCLAKSVSTTEELLREELCLKRKEVELLKGELRLCKNSFMRSGAAKAVQKMEEVYNKQMVKVEQHHGQVVSLMRERLQEIFDCLQKLVNHRMSSSIVGGDMDASTAEISLLSDALTDALNESKSLLDLNGTQLPESVYQFPTNEILMEYEDESSDSSQHSDSGTDLSPVTTKLMIGKRLKEYEKLMNELRDSSKRRVSAEGQVLHLKRGLNQAIQDRDDMKWQMTKHLAKVDELEGAVANLESQLIREKNVQAETGATVDGLRIKCGQLKELLKTLQDENQTLKNASKFDQVQTKKLQASEEKVHHLELEVRKLNERHLKESNEINILAEKLTVKDRELAAYHDSNDYDDLKKQLASANNRLEKYKERQEKVDRTLRKELAKTHVVLKQTKENLDKR